MPTNPNEQRRDQPQQQPQAGTTGAGAGARVARGATGSGLGGDLEAKPNTAHAKLSVPTVPGGTGAPQPGASDTAGTSDPNFPANHQQGGISGERGNTRAAP